MYRPTESVERCQCCQQRVAVTDDIDTKNLIGLIFRRLDHHGSKVLHDFFDILSVRIKICGFLRRFGKISAPEDTFYICLQLDMNVILVDVDALN